MKNKVPLLSLFVFSLCFTAPLPAAGPVSCEGMGLDERGLALCDSFFNAFGCGGGLQRDEVRCHRLGQEFQRQSGIPYDLLPGLVPSGATFTGNGGQLNLGEYLQLRLPEGVLDEPVVFRARLTPGSRTDAYFPPPGEAAAGVKRARLDIRLSVDGEMPALGEALQLQLDPRPFLASMDGVGEQGAYRLFRLAAGQAEKERLMVPLARGTGPQRITVTLPAAAFLRDPQAGGPRHEAVISVVSRADGPGR